MGDPTEKGHAKGQKRQVPGGPAKVQNAKFQKGGCAIIDYGRGSPMRGRPAAKAGRPAEGSRRMEACNAFVWAAWLALVTLQVRYSRTNTKCLLPVGPGHLGPPYSIVPQLQTAQFRSTYEPTVVRT